MIKSGFGAIVPNAPPPSPWQGDTGGIDDRFQLVNKGGDIVRSLVSRHIGFVNEPFSAGRVPGPGSPHFAFSDAGSLRALL